MFTNEMRADAVEQALHYFQVYKRSFGNSEVEDVIDILTDLRHYCDRENLCFDELDRLAHTHYLAELDEDKSQACLF